MLRAAGALLDRKGRLGHAVATLAQLHLCLLRPELETQQSGQLFVAVTDARIRNQVADELANGFFKVPPCGVLRPLERESRTGSTRPPDTRGSLPPLRALPW